MKKIALLFVLLCPALIAQNWTAVSASNITDAAGNKLASGQVCFLGTDQNNTPINFGIGGGGQVLKRAACTTVMNGAIAAGFQVPDPASTSPRGVLYRVWVTDTSTGQIVLQYAGVQFTGSSFDLDNYAPSGIPTSPLPANTTGNLSVGGTLSVTGSTALGVVNATTAAIKNIEQIRYADGFPGADIGAKVNAAIADLPSSGGIVITPVGIYPQSTQILVQKPVMLEGQGQGTVLQPTIANPIVLENGSAVPYLNGGMKNIVIDGINAPAGAIGIEQIDSVGMFYENVAVQNFVGSGSECLLYLNETKPSGEPGIANFNERTSLLHVHTYNCTTGMEFRKSTGGTGSFEYTHLFDYHADLINSSQNGNQVGIVVSGGAYIQHSHIEPFFNMSSDTGTATAVEVTGGSQITQSLIVMMAEATAPSNAIGVSVCSSCVFDASGYEDTFGIPDSIASGASYSWTSQATKVVNPSAPSGANTPGLGLTIAAQSSTGSAQGGSIVFQSSAGGASGSSANILTDLLSAAFGTDNKASLFIGGSPSAIGVAQLEYDPGWVVGGVTADLIGIADSGTKQLVGIDHSGNLGLASDLYAPAVVIGGGSTLATSNQTGTGSIVMSSNPSIASPTLTGTTTASTVNATTLQQGGTPVALASQLPLTGSLAGSTAALAAGTCGDLVTTTVSGAAVGAAVIATAPAAGLTSGLLIDTGHTTVTAANMVQTGYCNVSTGSITPAAATLTIRVMQ